MESIIKHLKNDKIQINQNKNPIPMDLFLSFFTVPVEKFKGDYLGKSTGWTKYVNESLLLDITGGICDGGHWLHDIQYGKKLQNGYNNYVNPFYLFPILNDEGKNFFYQYYKEDIDELLKKQKTIISHHKKMIVLEKENLSKMELELNSLTKQ